MLTLKPLNSKEVKTYLNIIKEQFGTTFSLDYYYFKSSKDKVFIINKDYIKIHDKKLNINNIGLYIFSIEKDGIRLSIDGSQLLKPVKNIIEINKEQLNSWFSGKGLEVDNEGYGYFAVKYDNDFLGSGKLKNNILKNFIPKQRRVVIT